MSVKIQIKRANASAWTAANPTLAAGEWGMELDTKKLKLGTGALWNATDYYSETLTLNSVGDVTITSLQNGDFLRYSSSASAWINDPVNLSTDTVGDYVQSLTAGTGVTLSNNSGEGATPTVAIGQAVGTSASVTFGQLTVNGQTNVGGNIIPNTNEAYDLGSASARFRDIYLSGTTINLGGAEITSDGTDISFSGAIGVSGSANFVGDLTGNADTASTLETSRAISLAGDLSGSASFDGSTNVTITATVQPNSVALGTDTTGNYVNDVVSGTGVTVTHAPGEGSSASIAIGQDVATSASVQFAKVTAPLDGNASTASTLQTPRTIALTGDVSGSVSFNGASDVSISATVQPNSVALGTDTTGNFVNDVTAGTGVTVTHTPGEGSSPTIAIGQAVGTSSSVQFAAVTAPLTGNVTGNADTATALQTARVIALSGDVSGSVSFNGTGNVDISTTIGANSVSLGSDTSGDYVSSLVAGTGVSLANNSGETATPTISIGQDIATSASVTFAKVDTTGDVTVGGNLTVNGTTTTLNTETLSVEDNIVVLNSNATGSPALNAGIEVERGDSANVVLRWNESTDKWETTNDGSAYSVIATNGNIALGTDTTGNYMSGVSASTGVTIEHTPGEGSSATISIGQNVAPSASVTFAAVSAPLIGNVTGDVSGNSGTATALQNSRVISIGGDVSGSVSFNGTSDVTISAAIQPNSVALGTDTTGNFVNDVTAGTGVSVTHTPGEGSSPTIAIGQAVGTSSSVQFAAVTAPLIGNASTATTLENPRTISLGGDVSGSVSFNGSSDVSISATIQPNSVGLGTDTSGDYVSSLVAGTGVTLTNNSGETATPTVAIGQDVATSASVTFASVNAPVSGNATSASTLQNSRTISLSGDVSGSVSFNGSSNVDIATTVQPNSVALGTDTTGNYVNDLTAGTGVTVTHTPGEGSSPTVAIGQSVATSASVTFAQVDTTGDVTVGGNLTVNGTTTTLNTETLAIEDNIVVLNSNVTGSPTTNAGIEIERGTSANVSVRWNESTDSWELTEDGSTYKNIAVGQDVETSASVQFVAVTAELVGNSSTSSALKTPRTIALSGDISGSVSFDGSANVDITATVQPNSVALGTDTTGNYVNDLTAGTGVTVTHTPGEGSSPTVAIGQAVGTSASVTFAHVSAPVTGNVTGNVTGSSGSTTGNAATATTLQNTRTISLSGDVSGSVSFDGSSNVDITATIQPNSIGLGTDTTGDFVSSLVAGTGVTLTNNSGESATPTIAIGQAVGTSSSVQFASVTAPLIGNVTGNADTATTLATSRTIELTGDVTGSVSFNGSANASIAATIQPNSVALGTDTTGNYVNDLTGGTGVTITHTPAEGSSPTVAIGQSVATSASVTFAKVDTTGDMTVGGNLTVNGTTTTLNTETLAIEDNIVVLNSNVTASPTTNAGIEVERGTSANVSLRWNETSDKWEFTQDGSTYYDIATEDFVNAQSISLLDDISDVSASTATAGDFLKYNGTAWINDPINLGTDTVGNYVNDLTAGTGVTVTHTPGEGSSPTVAIGQAVGTSSSVQFAAVSAPLIGNVTGNADTATALATSRTIELTGDVTGSVSFNGSANASITATIAANSVSLGTDTTGNYVADVVSGTGITISHTPGEGSSASVALNATLDDLSNVTAPSPTDGQFLKYVSASSAWVPAAVPTINALDDIGNVNAPTPTDGQVLKYVSASSAWVAADSTGGAAAPTTTTVSVNTATTIDSFALSAADSAEFTVKVKQGSRYESLKALALHNGTTVDLAQYGELSIAATETSLGTWTTRTSNFGIENINSVAYGNNLWVAVGDGGQLRSSTDGTTWTTRTSTFGGYAINSVAHGNNLWVAVGGSFPVEPVLRTSTDAITWTTRTSNFGNYYPIFSVAHGNNLWVAGSRNGELRSSTDGTTWTTRTSNFGSTRIRSIAYGNSLWVAVGYGGNIRTSTDAITWTTRTSNFGNTNIRSVAYGNNLWVAAGESGQLRTSTDAITWTTRTSNFGYTINSVAYGNNLWVAGGNGGIGTSTDAITWTTSTSNFGNTSPRAVAYGNNLFVAGAYSGEIRTLTVTTVSATVPLTLSADISGSDVRLRATITDAATTNAEVKVLKTTL